MFSIQSNKNCLLRAGTKLLSSDNSFSLSCMCVCRTYHSFNKIISIGFFPLSETGISWSLSSTLSSLSDSSKSSKAFFLASKTDNPAKGPPTSVIFPSKSIAWNGVKPNSLNTETSFWSPNEQTIKTPEPNSMLTLECAWTSTVFERPEVSIGNSNFLPTKF